MPWRYQGRLDLSPDPNEPLYDAGARRYRPSLGAFTALDTYAGSAINPLSLNRYLYAHANPTSLIDPTGHCVTCPPMLDGAYTLPTQGANAPVSAAAAQSQVAAAASWAPAVATSVSNASATNPGDRKPSGFAVPTPMPQIYAFPDQWAYYPPGGPIREGFCPTAAWICWAPGTSRENQGGEEVLSFMIQLIPGPGDIYQAGVITFGRDPISGYELSTAEREQAAFLFLGSLGLGSTQLSTREFDVPNLGTIRVSSADDFLPASSAVAHNLKAYLRKLPASATAVEVHQLPDASLIFSATVPGRVPDSFGVYVKHVTADGQTVGFTLTTIAPDGEIVSIENKMR